MKILIDRMSHLNLILAEQNVKNVDHRFLKFVQQLSFEDGLLLYNMLTGELVFLDKQEEKMIIPNNEVYNYLVKNWFLVPDDFDDKKFIKQIEDSSMAIKKVYAISKYRAFTILPTTDCNARCFYCFEHGCKRVDMDEKTAYDVVKYILANKADGKIQIRWFGGEPLCNTKVIDIICNELKDNNVDFISTMVSNSYLFDKELIKHAKEQWHLKTVQVTLDGTEEVYNKVKNYIYKDEISPFKKVLNNIEDLLQADIYTKIRLNVDKHNYQDLHTLINQLMDRFKKYENFYVYAHTLYENSADFVRKQTAEEIIDLEIKCDELYDIIKKHRRGKKDNPIIIKERCMTKCMGDSITSVMILPQGQLGKCEHFMDDHYIGSIYSDKINFDVLNDFKEWVLVWDKCLDCELRPMCYRLKECTNRERICYDAKKRRKIQGFNSEMLMVYNNYKEGLKNET